MLEETAVTDNTATDAGAASDAPGEGQSLLQGDQGEQTAQTDDTTTERTLLDDEAEDSAEPPQTQEAVPETYELTYPEGVVPDTRLEGAMTPVFKELGLPQSAAQKLAHAYAMFAREAKAEEAREVAEAIAADRKAIASIPDYKATVLAPARAALKLAGAEDAAHIAKYYGDDPAVIRLLAKIGMKLQEDRAPSGRSAPPVSGDPVALYTKMKR
jgi:hypothetical protein